MVCGCAVVVCVSVVPYSAMVDFDMARCVVIAFANIRGLRMSVLCERYEMAGKMQRDDTLGMGKLGESAQKLYDGISVYVTFNKLQRERGNGIVPLTESMQTALNDVIFKADVGDVIEILDAFPMFGRDGDPVSKLVLLTLSRLPPLDKTCVNFYCRVLSRFSSALGHGDAIFNLVDNWIGGVCKGSDDAIQVFEVMLCVLVFQLQVLVGRGEDSCFQIFRPMSEFSGRLWRKQYSFDRATGVARFDASNGSEGAGSWSLSIVGRTSVGSEGKEEWECDISMYHRRFTFKTVGTRAPTIAAMWISSLRTPVSGRGKPTSAEPCDLWLSNLDGRIRFWRNFWSSKGAIAESPFQRVLNGSCN